MLHDTLLAFIPVFVAVDAFGTLPIFVALTRQFDRQRKRRVLIQSLWTALSLALGFILLGKIIFGLLGITVSDFMIAGGIILFCIAIIDMLQPGKQRRVPPEQLGAVPIGTPLIVGPAVLTTSLVMVDQFGIVPTTISVFLNVLLAVIIFSRADFLTRILGEAGSRALSKVMALLLAAIAVMLIRKGIGYLILS